MSLEAFKRSMATDLYGMNKEDAHKQVVCIDCKQTIQLGVNVFTPADENEYRISGICSLCWAKMFNE